MIRRHTLTRLMAAAVLTAAATASAQTYSVTDLGVLSPYAISQSMAINGNGQITGSLIDSGFTQSQAFLYSSGVMATLGTMANTAAFGINDAGTVVGSMSVGFAQTHAFAHSGSYVDIGTFGGLNSIALGINNNGTVCGSALNGVGHTHAFLWQGGILIDIHMLAQVSAAAGANGNTAIINSTFSQAHDVNDSNDVAGYYTAANNLGVVTERAFHYRSEILTELANLGGTKSRALAINNSGRIVGWSELPTGAKRAVIFYINGNILNLGTPGSMTWSAAYAVNDGGVIVGSAGTTATNTVAFIYQNGTITDLNALIPSTSGWSLQAATGINSAGRITGYGLVNGQTHAFLLTQGTGPTPGGGAVPGTGQGLCGAGAGLPIALATLYLLAVSLRRRLA